MIVSLCPFLDFSLPRDLLLSLFQSHLSESSTDWGPLSAPPTELQSIPSAGSGTATLRGVCTTCWTSVHPICRPGGWSNFGGPLSGNCSSLLKEWLGCQDWDLLSCRGSLSTSPSRDGPGPLVLTRCSRTSLMTGDRRSLFSSPHCSPDRRPDSLGLSSTGGPGFGNPGSFSPTLSQESVFRC